MYALRLTLAALVLTGCFGNATRNGDDAGDSSGGSASASGGSAAGGSGSTSEAVFACGCLEGSDDGITLTLAAGGQIVFAEPPRFHDPDSIPGTTFPVDCDDAETPIYFDTKCTFFDLLEACHSEAGCLQIMRDSFVWLSPEGAKLQSGAATLERDSLSRVDNATLEAVNGVLGDSVAPLGTFSGQVCRLLRDDCMK